MQDEVRKVVKHSLKALSVDFGASHIEVIVNDKGPTILEVAGRAGGGLIPSDILPHLCGFDVIEKYIRLALGEDPQIPDFEPGNSVVLRFFKAPSRGMLESISGIDEVKRMKNVSKIDFIVKKGDILRPLKEDNDRVGFVIVKGKNRAEAARIADRAESLIKFKTR
jgi:biotin carboxylase